METSFRTTVVLAMIAVALSAYAYVFEQGPPSDQIRGRMFPDLRESEIIEIRLEPGAQTAALDLEVERAVPVTLRYEPDEFRGLPDWRIVEPFAFDAFLPRVEGILFGILELERIAPVIGEDDASLIFDESGPEMTVRFKSRDITTQDHVIEVGKDHPDAAIGLTYFRVDGGTPFLARNRFRQSFTPRLADLRERGLFPVPKEDAVDLEIERRGQPKLELTRTRGTQTWLLKSPLHGTADLAVLHGLLGDLNSWRIEQFVSDDVDDLSKYGFDDPRLKIVLTHRRGKVHRYVVADDPAGKLDGMVYMHPKDTKFVFAVADAALRQLEKPAEEYRSPYLLQLGASEITELKGKSRVDGVVREFRLWREEVEDQPGGRNAAPEPWWKIKPHNGETYDADPYWTGSILTRIKQLDVRRYLDDDVDPEIVAMLKRPDDATLELEMTLEYRDRPIRVLFFRPPELDDENFHPTLDFLAVRGGARAGSLVERTVVTTPLPNLLASDGVVFRERSLSRITVGDIQRVTIKSSEFPEPFPLVNIDGTWHYLGDVEPGKTFDELKVNIAMRLLSAGQLEASSFLPEETDLEKLELTPSRARLVISIELIGGFEGLSRLTIGAQKPPDRYYAITDTVDMPVLLSKSLVAEFEKLVVYLMGITRRE